MSLVQIQFKEIFFFAILSFKFIIIFNNYHEFSRTRTYIRNLEGFRPYPLDDKFRINCSYIYLSDTGFEPVASCL